MGQPSPASLPEKEIKDQVQLLGRKLGFFISTLNTSDEVKQTWLELLEGLSLSQLLELTDFMEGRFLEEQTRGFDEELRLALKDVFTKSKERGEVAAGETLKKFEALEAELDRKDLSRKS